MKLLAALLAMLLWLPGAARADELRPGYLEMSEQRDGDWRIVWKLPLAQPPAGAIPVPILPQSCRYREEPKQGFVGGAILGSGEAICTRSLAGGTIAVPVLAGPGDTLVRLAPLDQPVQVHRLTAAQPTATITGPASTWQVLQSYFVIGVEHILAGWDHLLFVIALVLLLRRPRAVVIAATAFTLAHSVTLAAAALGFVSMPQKPVEALIALSIVFMAAEILRKPGTTPSLTLRFPWVIALLFGLIHGFGFAGALSAIGLPPGDIVPALLAFNLGVEAGQILVVFAVLAALAAIRKLSQPVLQTGIRLASYGIGITGAYWLLDRILV
ncbi:HupE/UreJ family protein [Allopontixanthobacter sp.]|uniref:HupE/UreJ family protein n=1 Tax=Allopontixanthobacter sp. TaxID=2906452 RepID=UPI002ABC0984|nr:HupE/UreJ family protein [Allopontixanthobacter sp.]MDZ4308686.1 HupE/UreJ family protein [Allopontixanthobacter sp.]